MAGGQPRFGWTHVNGVLVQNEREQGIIARICELRNEPGPVSYTVIAGMLNAEGKLMRGRFWSATTVRSVYRKATEPTQQVGDIRREATGG